MGLIQSAKDRLGIGKSKEERLAEDMQKLSETYPDTPDGTFRCEQCGEVKGCMKVGGPGLGRTDDGDLTSVVFCNECSTQ